MKKVLTILLCAVLTLSFIGIADAAGEQTILGAEYVTNQGLPVPADTFREVTISLNIDEDFTVTIPADFSLHDSGNGVYKHFDEVSVFVKKIDPNKYLTITINSDLLANESGWYLEHTENSDNKLLFGIKLGQNVDDQHISGTDDPGLIRYDSAVISTKTIGSTVTQGMHFRLLSAVPTQSGVYKNTIKFTVSMTATEGAVYFINSNQNS